MFCRDILTHVQPQYVKLQFTSEFVNIYHVGLCKLHAMIWLMTTVSLQLHCHRHGMCTWEHCHCDSNQPVLVTLLSQWMPLLPYPHWSHCHRDCPTLMTSLWQWLTCPHCNSDLSSWPHCNSDYFASWPPCDSDWHIIMTSSWQ